MKLDGPVGRTDALDAARETVGERDGSHGEPEVPMHNCEFCDREFETEMGVSVHQSRSHTSELPWHNEATVRRLYCDEEFTIAELAERWDVGDTTVHSALERFGIERRDRLDLLADWNRTQPAHYRTSSQGYETWKTSVENTLHSVRVHRLCAVAWFGLDAVKDKVVHHRDPIPWLNTEENLEVMGAGEHSSQHSRALVDKMVFDENGDIVGFD